MRFILEVLKNGESVLAPAWSFTLDMYALDKELLAGWLVD